MADNELFEELAAIEHERWSDWQFYLHSQCTREIDGSLVIPQKYVERLEILMETPYAKLTEEQKDSDRDQVRRYWPLLSGGSARE